MAGRRRWPSTVLIFLLVIGHSWGGTVESFIRVSPGSGEFVDHLGRTRLFHGVDIPVPSVTVEDVSFLKAHGFNVVRLGCLWGAVQPQPGTTNTTYISQCRRAVDTLTAGDIFVILDAHQDMFADAFPGPQGEEWRSTGGDGAPRWAAAQYSSKEGALAFPSPLPVGTKGFPVYFADAVSKAFQHLYDHPQHFADFWSRVVESMVNASSYLLGYELINEPWVGDYMQSPGLLVPGVADRRNLQPFYHSLHKTIRAIDNERFIFYEPITYDIAASGFTARPSGSDTYRDREVLAYHVYCSVFREGHMKVYDWAICRVQDTDLMLQRLRDRDRLGGGSFLTEFGLAFDVPTQPDGLKELEAILLLADTTRQSWIFWLYYFLVRPDVPGQEDLIRTLSRTYAPAIAGIPLEHQFNERTGSFVLKFRVDKGHERHTEGGTRTTEIFLQEKLWYPEGFCVTITPEGAATWNHHATNYVHVVTTQDIAEGTVVEIRITRGA